MHEQKTYYATNYLCVLFADDMQALYSHKIGNMSHDKPVHICAHIASTLYRAQFVNGAHYHLL